MDITIFLAQVIGVYLIVVGLSLVLYPKRTRRMLHEVMDDYLLPYIGGALSLIVGLALVLVHNVWDDLTTSLVTLVGWSALIKGVLLFLLPHDAFPGMMEKFSTPRASKLWGLALLVLGVYLAYRGFVG